MIGPMVTKVAQMTASAEFKTRAMSVKDWGQIAAVIAAVSAGWTKLDAEIEHIKTDVARIERNIERITTAMNNKEGN